MKVKCLGRIRAGTAGTAEVPATAKKSVTEAVAQRFDSAHLRIMDGLILSALIAKAREEHGPVVVDVRALEDIEARLETLQSAREAMFGARFAPPA